MKPREYKYLVVNREKYVLVEHSWGAVQAFPIRIPRRFILISCRPSLKFKI